MNYYEFKKSAISNNLSILIKDYKNTHSKATLTSIYCILKDNCTDGSFFRGLFNKLPAKAVEGLIEIADELEDEKFKKNYLLFFQKLKKEINSLNRKKHTYTYQEEKDI